MRFVLCSFVINGFEYKYDCILHDTLDEIMIIMKLDRPNKNTISDYFTNKKISEITDIPTMNTFIKYTIEYFKIDYKKHEFIKNLRDIILNNILYERIIYRYVSSMDKSKFEHHLDDIIKDDIDDLYITLVPLIYKEKKFIYVDYVVNNERSKKKSIIIKLSQNFISSSVQMAYVILSRILEDAINDNRNILMSFTFMTDVINILNTENFIDIYDNDSEEDDVYED